MNHKEAQMAMGWKPSCHFAYISIGVLQLFERVIRLEAYCFAIDPWILRILS